MLIYGSLRIYRMDLILEFAKYNDGIQSTYQVGYLVDLILIDD